MNISYDIFDLVDFPIVITDKDFIIIYKNHIACEYFGKLRKRSKITRYLSDYTNNADFSVNSEAEFETGTLIKRALVFLEKEYCIFLFLSAVQFENYDSIVPYIKEKFAGSFSDFYFSAYKEYLSLQAMTDFEKAHVPERTYADLLELIRILADKPSFMQKEGADLAELIAYIAKHASNRFRALGLKVYLRPIYSEAYDFCRANICLTNFLFLVFRLIYTGFKFSSDGNVQISINYLHTNHADICVSVHTHLQKKDVSGKSYSALLKLLPEFSFEFDILEKCGIFELDTLSYELENSVLKLHLKVKCACGETLFVRSESLLQRKKRTAQAVSAFICKTKKLLSKN